MLVSNIAIMKEPPSFQSLAVLTNRGRIYFGDDLDVLTTINETDRFINYDTKIKWLSRYADLVTRSQYDTEWYR